MTQLFGDRAGAVDDALLRELFLQRLPANVQIELPTASDMNLSALVALADAGMEVAFPTIPILANPRHNSEPRSSSGCLIC